MISLLFREVRFAMAAASADGLAFEDGLLAVVVAAGRSSRMKGVDKTFAEVGGVLLVVHTLQRLGGIGGGVPDCAGGGGGCRRPGGRASAAIRGSEGVVNLRRRGTAAGFGGGRPGGARRRRWRWRCGCRPVGGGDGGAGEGYDKVVDGDGIITDTPERVALWAAQTPPVFERGLL